jgi:signal transduction histidine kinase
MGYIGLLQRRATEREDRELLAAAEQEARRIDRIVRGLLDYARPRETRVHRIAVNEVVERVLELLENQGRFKEVTLVKELAPALPAVSADPYQLEQVLVNLVLNAMDAMEGTRAAQLVVTTRCIRVEPKRRQPTRRRDDPPDVDYSHRRRFHQTPRIPRELRVPASGEVVEISVRDTGPGIPAELVDQIFEPFVTTKEPGKGTGLGLAVAARLIDAMEGTIRVESRSGEGATFTIVLPAVAGATGDTDR